jgi:uncharacterized membrane protein
MVAKRDYYYLFHTLTPFRGTKEIAMGNPNEQTSIDEIAISLKRLEERIARIEEHLGLEPAGEPGKTPSTTVSTMPGDEEEKLELQLGQNWFAKVGIAVLALGIIFLLTFPYKNLPPALPSLFGYALVGGIVALSRFWRDSFQQVSRYLLGGGLLLLYFSTLRLSHFSPEPAITSVPLEVGLLLAVVALNLTVAARRQSVYLTGMNLFCGFLTALLAAEPYPVFVLTALMAVVAVMFWRKFEWNATVLLGILFANMTHLLWAVNNPVIGNRLGLVSEPGINLLFVLLYAMIFGTAGLLRTREQQEGTGEIVIAFMNGIFSYSLLLLLTLTSFEQQTVLWHAVASVLYLGLSVFFWVRRRARYATFVYAMLGYTALSVAIIAQFKIPDFFVWLCWQSVLVVSTAVWFRSRLIVVGNFVIYVMVFIAYLFAAGTLSAVSLSFGVVALISARILNWQKDRLELRTEAMRYSYLGSALFVIPYALYHTVPSGFVSLSWLVVALLYYVISRLLNNRKYRWMSLLTISMTILYVVFVDMVGVDPTLRIISFLVLGTALLLISMFYTRRRASVERAKEKKEG